MQSRVEAMMSLTSYNILAVDLSYRNTGVAMLTCNNQNISIEMMSLENPPLGSIQFDKLDEAMKNFEENTLRILRQLGQSGFDMMVIEVPCFPQSSLSAIAIGMCWGGIASIANAITIKPAALKLWSDSAKGDEKKAVKRKVMERAFLTPSQASNDNIVDAAGIALMTSDYISTIRHEKHNANQQPINSMPFRLDDEGRDLRS